MIDNCDINSKSKTVLKMHQEEDNCLFSKRLMCEYVLLTAKLGYDQRIFPPMKNYF